MNWIGELGLKQLEAAAQRLAAKQFEQLAMTEGFMRMDEAALGRLLDDDHLAARNEETVWEAVAVWRNVEGDGQARGRGLVVNIRFPLIEEGYLRARTRSTRLPPAHPVPSQLRSVLKSKSSTLARPPVL